MTHMSMQSVGNGEPPRSGFADYIAANVRAACGRRGVSQAALVRLTSLTRSTLNRKWHGHYPYDVAELEDISRALGAGLAELLEGTVDGYRTPTGQTASNNHDTELPSLVGYMDDLSYAA